MVFKKGQRILEPDVYIDPQHPEVVVKDYSRYERSMLKWGAMFLAAREARIMTTLHPICPKIIGRENLKIRMERVGGNTNAPLSVPQADRLSQLVALMHTKRIAHNDLHRSNVMVDEDQVFLIDFASAIECPAWFPLSAVLMQRDRDHVAKIKHKSNIALNDQESHSLNKPRWVTNIQSLWKNIYRHIR